MQKNNRPTILEIADQLMDGDAKAKFLDFLGFLKLEKIGTPWGSTNSFNANFKGKRVARILIGLGSRLEHNNWRITVATTNRGRFDSYVEGLPDDIRALFMEKLARKCTGCGVCAPGKSFTLAGEQYSGVCFGGIGTVGFCYTNPSEAETALIKRLIITRKEYIIKMLNSGQDPGGL
jgi:hypothetical protein